MALVSVDSNSLYGFNAIVEIDQTLFSQKKLFTTETKTVEGMPDVKWYLKFYPIDPNDGTKFGIYACIESEKEINYKIYTVSGTNVGGKKEFCIEQESHARLFDPRYSRFTNGKYTLKFQGTFSCAENGLKNIPKIRNPTELCERLQQTADEDFNILVGDQTFAIHKFLISAESTVFKRMFEDKFKEAEEGKVTITDFNVQVVKGFVDYCYGRDISTVLQDETDEINLLYFVDKYDCKTLKPQLENYFASKLSKENISLYVATSDKTNALQLRQACVQFVRNILYRNDSLTDEEMESFDIKFTKDVFAGKQND